MDLTTFRSIIGRTDWHHPVWLSTEPKRYDKPGVLYTAHEDVEVSRRDFPDNDNMHSHVMHANFVRGLPWVRFDRLDANTDGYLTGAYSVTHHALYYRGLLTDAVVTFTLAAKSASLPMPDARHWSEVEPAGVPTLSFDRHAVEFSRRLNRHDSTYQQQFDTFLDRANVEIRDN